MQTVNHNVKTHTAKKVRESIEEERDLFVHVPAIAHDCVVPTGRKEDIQNVCVMSTRRMIDTEREMIMIARVPRRER